MLSYWHPTRTDGGRRYGDCQPGKRWPVPSYCPLTVLPNPRVTQVRHVTELELYEATDDFCQMALRGNRKTQEQLLHRERIRFDQSQWNLVCPGPKSQHFTSLQLIDGDSCQGLGHIKVIQEPIKFIMGPGGDKIAPRAKVYCRRTELL